MSVELEELGSKKEKKMIIVFIIVICIIIGIFIYNKVTQVTLDMPKIKKNISLGGTSKITDYIITNDTNNRVQIKLKVDVPINTYTFCYVLNTKGIEIKGSYCILPLNTELGVIDAPKEENYILSLYSPLNEGAPLKYHLDLKYLAKNKKADLTTAKLNSEELEKSNKAVIDDFIINNKIDLLMQLMHLSLKKEELVKERDKLQEDAKRYKGKDKLNYDSTITNLYEKEEELKTHMKTIENKYKYIIKVLKINPKLYTQNDVNYIYLLK